MIKKWLSLSLLVFCFSCVEFDPDNARKDSRQEEECVGLSCNQGEERKAQVGIVKQSQLFTAFQKCLRLDKTEISAETKSLYSESRQILPTEGDSGAFSPPVSMAVTQTAGAFCQDLINVEAIKTDRIYLSAFDLSEDNSGARNPNLLNLNIEKLAKSCWGKNPEPSEIQLIADKFKASSLAGVVSRPGALFVCTLTLSSMDIVVY